MQKLPADWREVLGDAVHSPEHSELLRFVEQERARSEVFPPDDQVYAAFHATPFESTRVVLLGQDPYHGPGQAHGLCFSVPRGIRPPPSLANIFKELESERGMTRPEHGCLRAWAERGVLMLNTVLTVRAGEAASHRKRGWERLTDAAIRALDGRKRPVVFALWGGHARKKAKLVDAARHPVVERAHPSPLSAHRGFLGTRPFAAIDDALHSLGEAPMDWSLPA